MNAFLERGHLKDEKVRLWRTACVHEHTRPDINCHGRLCRLHSLQGRSNKVSGTGTVLQCASAIQLHTAWQHSLGACCLARLTCTARPVVARCCAGGVAGGCRRCLRRGHRRGCPSSSCCRWCWWCWRRQYWPFITCATGASTRASLARSFHQAWGTKPQLWLPRSRWVELGYTCVLMSRRQATEAG